MCCSVRQLWSLCCANHSLSLSPVTFPLSRPLSPPLPLPPSHLPSSPPLPHLALLCPQHRQQLEQKVLRLTEQLDDESRRSRSTQHEVRTAQSYMKDYEDRMQTMEGELAAGDFLKDTLRVDKKRVSRRQIKPGSRNDQDPNRCFEQKISKIDNTILISYHMSILIVLPLWCTPSPLR